MSAPRSLADAADAIPALRRAGVGDATLAAAYGVSRQAIHARFGPRPPQPAAATPAAPLPNLGRGDPAARLPAALLAWRRRRGLSQADAAATLGITVSTWARWESGAGGCGVPALVLRLLDPLDRQT